MSKNGKGGKSGRVRIARNVPYFGRTSQVAPF